MTIVRNDCGRTAAFGVTLLLFSWFGLRAASADFPRQAQVTRDFVRVRQAAGLHGKVSGVLFKNMIVSALAEGPSETIDGKTARWYQVKGESLSGWIFGEFLDFTLANKDKDTYSGDPDLTWFFKKYGESTHEYSRLKPEDLSVEQYRSLLTAVETAPNPDPPSYALLYTAYHETQDRFADPLTAYLKPKLFSPTILSAVLRLRHEIGGTSPLYENILEGIPSERWDDEGFIKKLPLSPRDFRRFSPRLRDDPAIMGNPCCLPFASTRLKGNKLFLLTLPSFLCAESSRGPFVGVFREVAPLLRDDDELAIKACVKAAPNISFVSDRLANDTHFWEILFASDTWLSSAAYDYDYGHHHAGEDEPAFRTDHITNPKVIQMIFKRSTLSAKAFAKQIVASCTNQSSALKWVDLRPDAMAFFPDSYRDDEQIVNTAVAGSGSSFQFASDRLRGHRPLAIEAIKQNAEMLNYLTEPLIGDEALALLAMNVSNGRSFVTAPGWARANKKVALFAVARYPAGACHTAGGLRNDKEIALAALRAENGSNVYFCLPDTLKADPDVSVFAPKPIKPPSRIQGQTSAQQIFDEGPNKKPRESFLEHKWDLEFVYGKRLLIQCWTLESGFFRIVDRHTGMDMFEMPLLNISLPNKGKYPWVLIQDTRGGSFVFRSDGEGRRFQHSDLSPGQKHYRELTGVDPVLINSSKFGHYFRRSLRCSMFYLYASFLPLFGYFVKVLTFGMYSLH